LTDWILWTRDHLTKADQEWFYSLDADFRLDLWTGEDLEDHLKGSAELLRSTYFGELVLTPDTLREQHSLAVAPIKDRWVPALHQMPDAELEIERQLGTRTAWDDLDQVAQQLRASTKCVQEEMDDLPSWLRDATLGTVQVAVDTLAKVVKAQEILIEGNLDLADELGGELSQPPRGWDASIRRLRTMQSPLALVASNMVADTRHALKVVRELLEALESRTLAVIGQGGYGKTQVSAQLTTEKDGRPSGLLLLGTHLCAGDGLDALARRVICAGKPVPSFDALAAALNAAGQRCGRRLPLLIDGLNEAEDPRDWKIALAATEEQLKAYPYVLLVVTLRPDVQQASLPQGMPILELHGFQENLASAIHAYFEAYLIDASDAAFAWKLLNHPIMLRMFCEVTNPERKTTVGVEAMPTSLTAMFDRYLELAADRIYELSPRTSPHYQPDVRAALSRIGLALWHGKTRSVGKDGIRKLLNDDQRSWHDSIIRALEYEGLLIRYGRNDTAGDLAILYDALAGHIVADAILEDLGSTRIDSWIRCDDVVSALGGSCEDRHPLAEDIFSAFVGLLPRRMYRQQLWTLLDEPLKTKALQKAAWLERESLDGETVDALATIIKSDPEQRHQIFDRLVITRAARSHPLDSRFLDSLLRELPIADRDLSWTEWVRTNQRDVIADLERLEARWAECHSW
jgi:hypothetical protein